MYIVSKTIYNQKSREASKVLKPTRAGDAIIAGQDGGLRKSRTIMNQSYAYSAKADKQLTEIYKEMSKIQQNVGNLKSQLSKLRNQNSESTTHQSTGHNNTKRECGTCHGLKTCSHCAGRGMRKSSETGNWYDCAWCRGKGVCPVCKGRGYFTRDTTLDPVN